MSQTGGIHVLHVDDEPDVAELAADMLKREDDRFTVETATDPSRGLDRLAADDFDCIVSDYQMPGQNGIEFLERVREDYPNLPFILFTGKGTEAVASDAISAGATDYLQKGVGTEQYELLANRIQNAVEQYRAQQRAAKLDRVRTLASNINQALVRADSRSEVETRVCEIISESEPYLFAWIGGVDPEHNRLEPRAWAGVEEGYLDAITITTDDTVKGQGPAGTAARERRIAVTQNVHEASEFEPWQQDALERGYQAVAAVPIQYEDTLYGVLAVYAGRPHAFDGDERELLTELGNDIAHAIHSFDVREQLRTERDRRQALFENAPGPVIAAEIHEGGDDIVMADVNEAFEDVFGYEAEEVVGNDPTELLVPEGGMDRHQQFREQASSGDTVLTQVERITADGLRTFLLQIIPYGVDDTHAEGLYAWLTDITEQEEHRQTIEELHSTARGFMEAETAEEVAETAVQAAGTILDLPASSIHLYDEDNDSLPPIAWTDSVEELIGIPPKFSAGDGLAWEVFTTGERHVYTDVSTVPGRRNPETEVRSQLILPLDDHGVFLVGGERPDAFDDTDISLADTLATHVTTALDRIERGRSLRREREFIDQALEALNDVFYVVGPDGTLRRWEDRLSEVTGYTDEEIADMQASDFFPEGDRERVVEAIEETLTTGDSVVEAELVTADGDHIPYEFTGSRLTDTEGNRTGIIGIGRDITERKQRERELEETNTVLRTILEALPMGVLVEDADRDILVANETLCEVMGLPVAAEELIGRNCATAADEIKHLFADPVGFVTGIEESIDQHEPVRNEELVLADGRTLERDHIPYTLPEGEAHLWLYRDVTARKTREEALSALHGATRDLMDASDKETVADRAVETARAVLEQPITGLWLHDPDDAVLRPVTMSTEAAALLDEPPTYTGDASLSWQAFEDGDLRVYDEVHAESERLNPETPMRSEIIVPLGEYGVMNIGATEPAGFSETDISLAKLLGKTVEAALARAEREQQLRSQRAELERQNERLEKFTSVVSHDLRNPLNVAEGRLELAQDECDSDHLDDVAQAHERMKALIDDLLTLALSGNRVDATEPVDLADIIDGCWQTVETFDATLVSETDWTIRADSSRLKQLLENLFRNAVEHAGDEVTVTVGDLDDGNGFYVADDGPGIPDEEYESVFNAGYSTIAEGTGFGLRIVQEIVEAHGWEITVTDSEHGGTRFEITGVETGAE